MAPKEPSDDEVRQLISECVGIVKEDRERAQYQTLHERFGAKPEESGEPGEGDPPPAKETVPEPKVEYGLWGKKPVR